MSLTSQIEKPAISSRVSANGPAMTVRLGPSQVSRLSGALFLRPAPATNTPALTSSSMNRSIAANASGEGGAPLSLSSVVFANTITRLVSLLVRAFRFRVSLARRTSLLEIDAVLQTLLDVRSARKDEPRHDRLG